MHDIIVEMIKCYICHLLNQRVAVIVHVRNITMAYDYLRLQPIIITNPQGMLLVGAVYKQHTIYGLMGALNPSNCFPSLST